MTAGGALVAALNAAAVSAPLIGSASICALVEFGQILRDPARPCRTPSRIAATMAAGVPGGSASGRVTSAWANTNSVSCRSCTGLDEVVDVGRALEVRQALLAELDEDRSDCPPRSRSRNEPRTEEMNMPQEASTSPRCMASTIGPVPPRPMITWNGRAEHVLQEEGVLGGDRRPGPRRRSASCASWPRRPRS